CPVSMGVMMWLMMRGGHQQRSSTPEHIEQRRRIAALERELAELRGAEADDTEPSAPPGNVARSLVDV
ncbi:MAG: hypothetical protein E6J45_10640, partial [Chloroflexi bacterium]